MYAQNDVIDSIMNIERTIIAEHIKKHKWCNHLSPTEGMVDFAQKFAWLMREVYCGAMCPHREDCQANDEYREAFNGSISGEDKNEYIKYAYGDEEDELIELKLHVIKHDIKTHKWLNKISNYEDAVRDFLKRFGWVIYEVYRKSKKEI